MNEFPCLHVNRDGAPVKYRGECTADGSYVYGNAAVDNYVIQFDYPRPTLYIDCKPHSIGLLLGMDKNYEEVYTGDTLIYEEDGTEFKAGALTSFTEIYKLKKDYRRRK